MSNYSKIDATRTASGTPEQFRSWLDEDQAAEVHFHRGFLTYDDVQERVVFKAGAEARLIARFDRHANGRRETAGSGSKRSKFVAKLKGQELHGNVRIERTEPIDVGLVIDNMENILDALRELPAGAMVFEQYHLWIDQIADSMIRTSGEASESVLQILRERRAEIEAEIASLKMSVAEAALNGDTEKVRTLAEQIASWQQELQETAVKIEALTDPEEDDDNENE